MIITYYISPFSYLRTPSPTVIQPNVIAFPRLSYVDETTTSPESLPTATLITNLGFAERFPKPRILYERRQFNQKAKRSRSLRSRFITKSCSAMIVSLVVARRARIRPSAGPLKRMPCVWQNARFSRVR